MAKMEVILSKNLRFLRGEKDEMCTFLGNFGLILDSANFGQLCQEFGQFGPKNAIFGLRPQFFRTKSSINPPPIFWRP